MQWRKLGECRIFVNGEAFRPFSEDRAHRNKDKFSNLLSRNRRRKTAAPPPSEKLRRVDSVEYLESVVNASSRRRRGLRASRVEQSSSRSLSAELECRKILACNWLTVSTSSARKHRPFGVLHGIAMCRSGTEGRVVFTARCCTERGIATASRLSVCLSDRDVEVSWSHMVGIFGK